MQERILEAQRRGAHHEALALAREAVEAAPDDATLHHLLARALAATDDPVGALAAIDRAIALSPEDASLHLLRAGLLLDGRDVEAGQAALATTVQLDPNQFGAYVMQSQVALGKGDVDEAERTARLAARVAPEHPWTRMLNGMIALHRNESDRAITLLSAAAQQAPDEPQIQYALGMAYQQKGHLAFAERAFQNVLAKSPDGVAIRGLVAEVQRQQGRFDDALQTFTPLLSHPGAPAVAFRFAGELELACKHPDAAMPLLKRALAMNPSDEGVLNVLMQAWHDRNDRDDARNTLDAALATTPTEAEIWRARAAVEAPGSDETLAVIERWLAAQPDDVRALEMSMSVQALRGDNEGAEMAANRIVAQVPDHVAARMRIVDNLMTRDIAAAPAYIDALIVNCGDSAARPAYLGWSGLALDRVGRHAEAVERWSEMQASSDGLPPPEPTPASSGWPLIAAPADDVPPLVFLAGAPGSSVERIATLLSGCMPAFRADRFGNTPPRDPLQIVDTLSRLATGEIATDEVAVGWSTTLASRGIGKNPLVDWLLWWDNALVAVLRKHLPQARVILALRDPRDMLLDWLAFTAPLRLAFGTPVAAARWLAAHLEHVAVLEEQSPVPHVVIRMDAIFDDETAIAAAVGEALQARLPTPPAGFFGAPRFAAGHWRAYADVLAEPFAALTPIARRLGYPET